MPEFDIHYALKTIRRIMAPDRATAEKRAKELVATTSRARLLGVYPVCMCPDCVVRRESSPGLTDISKGIDSSTISEDNPDDAA